MPTYRLRNRTLTYFDGQPVDDGWVDLAAAPPGALENNLLVPEAQALQELLAEEQVEPAEVPTTSEPWTEAQQAEWDALSVEQQAVIRERNLAAQGLTETHRDDFLPFMDPVLAAHALAAVLDADRAAAEAALEVAPTEPDSPSPDAPAETDPAGPLDAEGASLDLLVKKRPGPTAATLAKIAATKAANRAKQQLAAEETDNG